MGAAARLSAMLLRRVNERICETKFGMETLRIFWEEWSLVAVNREGSRPSWWSLSEVLLMIVARVLVFMDCLCVGEQVS